MKRNHGWKIFSTAIALLFVFGGAGVFSQEKAAGKYAALCGDYEFDFEGQVMVISFWEEDGRLMAAPEGESSEEINPMEGEELKFDVTVSANGQYYEIEFVKNDQGEIDTCIMRVMGMELEGTRIK